MPNDVREISTGWSFTRGLCVCYRGVWRVRGCSTAEGCGRGMSTPSCGVCVLRRWLQEIGYGGWRNSSFPRLQGLKTRSSLECVSHLPGAREPMPTDYCTMSPLRRRIHSLDNSPSLFLLSCGYHPLCCLGRRLPVLRPTRRGSRAFLCLCLHSPTPYPSGPCRALVHPRA